ncbi:MAG: PEP-CTERM sorting domain-containing protein [Planctomycetes bacterium]|nr:PEP-CTERM sorting domain-containing protein [Planctomycetota bacterium]
MSLISRFSVVAVVAGVACLGAAQSAHAAFTTGGVTWKGVTWGNAAGANVSVDDALPGGNLVLRSNVPGAPDGTGYSYYINPGTFSAWYTALNSAGTPWLQVSYIDRISNAAAGTNAGVTDFGLFLNGPATSHSGLRFIAGRYFDNDSIGVMRQSSAGAKTGETYVTDGSPSAPIAGTSHTVRIGKLADGSLEFTVDGVTGASTYPTDANANSSGANWTIYQVELRFRGQSALASGSFATFTDFTYGNNYTSQIPEPASLGLMGLGSMLVLARRRKA